jgi:hypothetical protein
MAPTKQQKAFCAVEYAKTSVITVQRNFRRQFEVDPPDKNSIKRWHIALHIPQHKMPSVVWWAPS